MSLLRLFTSKAPAVSSALRSNITQQYKSLVRRSFSTAPALWHGKPGVAKGDGPYTVNFVMPDGEEISVKAVEGDTMLDLAQRYDIDLECACEGSLACSTCHVILEPEYYDKMEEPSDEENDMLDLAFGLTETSRLGCQIEMNDELDGLTVRLPSATRNMRVDGSKPVHH
ncbi:2Fe-2S ferredoxin-type domain-containing protein [Zychaea mexicana]|uniref:2Fe-2S ferredoxin-type domain-containing protein n=1 Tax=Zychaea mexicana TaxID=64656 RepID=UPI0022FE1962|nr:2Fe-2S ferredoxin-type domain-containing protein [Zychaea mexicana]KAI9493232.1 2Fe-2S ferredoxin-type domain-containing protein [Zychaea mexicana]